MDQRVELLLDPTSGRLVKQRMLAQRGNGRQVALETAYHYGFRPPAAFWDPKKLGDGPIVDQDVAKLALMRRLKGTNLGALDLGFGKRLVLHAAMLDRNGVVLLAYSAPDPDRVRRGYVEPGSSPFLASSPQMGEFIAVGGGQLEVEGQLEPIYLCSLIPKVESRVTLPLKIEVFARAEGNGRLAEPTNVRLDQLAPNTGSLGFAPSQTPQHLASLRVDHAAESFGELEAFAADHDQSGTPVERQRQRTRFARNVGDWNWLIRLEEDNLHHDSLDTGRESQWSKANQLVLAFRALGLQQRAEEARRYRDAFPDRPVNSPSGWNRMFDRESGLEQAY